MRRQAKLGRFLAGSILGVICLLAAGCTTSLPCGEGFHNGLAPHTSGFPCEAHGEPATTVSPRSLVDLIALTTENHPELRAARARVDAAQGALIQAGLAPNPVVGPEFKALGQGDQAVGEIGLSIMQTIVTAKKLELAQAAAAQGVTAADWDALTRWFMVVTRVRMAYVDWLAAVRERDTLSEMTRLAQDIHQATQTLEKAGAGNRPDVLRAKVELEQQTLKKQVADAKLEAARRALALAVGVQGLRLEELRGNPEELPPAFTFTELAERTRQTSSELQEARARILQHESLLAKAQADARPNIDVSVLPYYSAVNREWSGEVAITAAIPIHNRNEGNILTARADLARARADERIVELRLGERLTAAYQRYEAARIQADSYLKRILPDARESVRLVQIGYRGGDPKYNYTALLQAQQVLFEAQLAHVYALAEWQRAAAELAGIAQIKD